MGPHIWPRSLKTELKVNANEIALNGKVPESRSCLKPKCCRAICSKCHDHTNQSRVIPPSTATATGTTTSNPTSSNVTSNFKQHSISSGTILKSSQPRPIHPQNLEAPEGAMLTEHSTSIGAIRTVSMYDTDRSRSRKERTFVGGQCAACDELLEHTLSGERVLQFSCGHVAHEACLYEYIKDSDSQFCPSCDAPLGLDASRAGNFLDFRKSLDLNKLSNAVRPISHVPAQLTLSQASPEKAGLIVRDREEMPGPPPRPSRAGMHEDIFQSSTNSVDLDFRKVDRPAMNAHHSRNNSDPINLDLQPQIDARRHDYDLSAMESRIPQAELLKTIPSPKVAIRSEFPTLTRSSQQQSLTCLVTVEVPSSRARSRISEQSRTHLANRLSTTIVYPQSQQQLSVHQKTISKETEGILAAIADELKYRVDNWHGLDFEKFGPLRLHGTLQVGKDGNSWQDLECYLFHELLICLKEKQTTVATQYGERPKCSLKGSILIKRHLKDMQASTDDLMLSLNLVVPALPCFHLKFASQEQLELWRYALQNLEVPGPALVSISDEQDSSGAEEDDWSRAGEPGHRASSILSSRGSPRTGTTSTTDYSDRGFNDPRLHPTVHVPIDVVIVIPVSSSMQGLKIKLLQDALRFMVHNLGDKDRMGLVTFGSNGGAMPMVGMTTRTWPGWSKALNSIKPVGQKSLRADCVEGASVAMDLLMQRKGANPISSILLISDSPASDTESVDFVVQRAETAKVSIHTFGLGQTHKPDSLIELSARTKASYVYVKDWMMIRECVAGCLGSLQSVSHLSAKLKLKIPEGSPAKIVKISGALQTTRRPAGRDAEALIGDLRFGDKRDILVQLSVDTDPTASPNAPHDHWDSIVSGLEALSGALEDNEPKHESLEEVPLIQADLAFSDLEREGLTTHLSQPSLLIITMLPETPKPQTSKRRSGPPPIPSHPAIVQRRMELLTSDMLTRALTLVTKGQHERAHHLLAETKSILQGFGKGSLPPLPLTGLGSSGSPKQAQGSKESLETPRTSTDTTRSGVSLPGSTTNSDSTTTLPPGSSTRVPSLDQKILEALKADLDTCLEYIDHPAVFSHDARKAALQTIGVISSQRGYTFRTTTESIWAGRIPGVKALADFSREWRATHDETLAEELE